MVITGVECNVLVAPCEIAASTDTSFDDVVVQVHTDGAATGIGEVESNSWVIRSLIQAPGTGVMNSSLGSMLTGCDPCDPVAIWDRLYRASLLVGRRGAGICAIGALDIAVWDAYGQCLGKPVWQLLGGEPQPFVTPYASLLPRGDTLEQYRNSLLSKVEWARDFGFRAVKAEILVAGPYAEPGLSAGHDAIVELTAACRATLGADRALMIDVGYCCADAADARRLLRRLEKYDLSFVETPLPTDDLAGYAALAGCSAVPIAAGELLQTRFEFEELMDRGGVAIVQPDIGRVGGLSEARQVARMAAERGKLVVPHCWKSGIGIAASIQLASVLPNCPYFEFLPAQMSESPIRRRLVNEDFPLAGGRMPLPGAPGLGVTLNQRAFNELRDAAQTYWRDWIATSTDAVV
jgi:L-alanine-DL-glutamate epimerase-like enolase superfamily enzyme